MKKRISLFLIICLTLGLAGCDQTGPKNTEESENSQNESDTSKEGDDIRIVNLTTRERETLDMDTLIQAIPNFTVYEDVIQSGESKDGMNAAMRNSVMVDGKMYYSYGYASAYYYLVQTGEELPEFQTDYNTKIYVYDFETGENTLIYQYDEEYAVYTANMRYENACLIWEEFLNPNTGGIDRNTTEDWYVRTLHLTDGTTSHEPLVDEIANWDEYGELTTQVDEAKKVEVNVTCQTGKQWTKITIEVGEQATQIGVDGFVDEAISDGRICVWEDMLASVDSLHIYDMVNDKYYRVGFVPMSEVYLYKMWLLIDQSDGLYAYNIPDGFYTRLSDGNVGTFYEKENGIYALRYKNGGSEVEIIHIE